MDAKRWARIEQICEEALGRPEEEQSAYLECVCGADESLRWELESLLEQRRHAQDFLEVPVVQLAARVLASEENLNDAHPSRMVGRLIGSYRIVARVASGGMGDVFRAVRADGTYDKEVAIKLIQGAHSTDFFLARFQNERQILANLDHPNIARLLDGGTTEEGLPYVVIEYIHGLPVDQFCRQNRLTIRERLEQFRIICSAVHYAHQHLVVHRDLKPANILVTEDRVPKLLDFGIAKILNEPHSEANSAQTVTLLRMLTPAYASPEQVRNEPISTASDVYSLGVVLYELLTDRSPFVRIADSPDALVKAICATEPEKPSTAAQRPREGAKTPRAFPETPQELRRILAGDLDKVVLKALRKEPQRRYASAAQFSEDLGRYLAGMPVLAHKDTLGYRTRKFLRRHRLATAGVTLLLLSMAGGLISTLWQAHIAKAERARAERRFNDVRSLAHSLMFEINDSVQNLSGSTPARKLIVTKSLQYLDSLSQEASGDPSLQEELASAYEKVGDLQGDPYAANLGDTSGALASYRKATAIRQFVASKERNSLDKQAKLADDYRRVSAGLMASGNYSAALDYAQKHFVIRQVLVSAQPTAESEERLAGAYYLMAFCQEDLGQLDLALANFRQSVALRESIAKTTPNPVPGFQVRLAGTYGSMASVLSHRGNGGEAISLYGEASALLERLSASDPTNRTYREYLYECIYYTGITFYANGKPASALQKYRKALSGFEALSADDPKEVRARRFVGLCYRQIGKAQVVMGSIAQGLESAKQGLAIAQELYSSDPTERSDKLSDLADMYAAVGLAWSRAAAQRDISRKVTLMKWKEARAAYSQSLSLWTEAKRLGAVSYQDAQIPNLVASELTKCDAAIAALATSTSKGTREPIAGLAKTGTGRSPAAQSSPVK